ncbi:hypothetical protein Tco_0256308 [Tanacetum coccineum]
MGYAPPCYVDTYKRKISGHKDENDSYCSTSWPVPFLEWNRLVNIEAIENVVENESHFSLEVVDEVLVRPSGGSGGLIEGRLGERCGGNGRRGGSISRAVGGLVVKGRSSLRESRRGEVGGVENKSSIESRLMANGVSKRLEVAEEMIGESSGIEVGEVGGGAET